LKLTWYAYAPEDASLRLKEYEPSARVVTVPRVFQVPGGHRLMRVIWLPETGVPLAVRVPERVKV
jgi:hypothetical protein